MRPFIAFTLILVGSSGSFAQTYTMTWKIDPADCWKDDKGYVVLALPPAKLAYQTAKYSVKGVKEEKVVESNGDRLLYVLPDGKTTIQLEVVATCKPHTFRIP